MFLFENFDEKNLDISQNGNGINRDFSRIAGVIGSIFFDFFPNLDFEAFCWDFTNSNCKGPTFNQNRLNKLGKTRIEANTLNF